MDTIERLRRTVSEVLAEPIREIVQEAVGEVIDHHLRQAMDALQRAPWPDAKRTPRKGRALALVPPDPPRVGAGASARVRKSTEAPIVLPPPTVIETVPRFGRNRPRVATLVEERRNGRVIPRGAEMDLAEAEGKERRRRARAKNLKTPPPIDHAKPHTRGLPHGKDYGEDEKVSVAGDPTIPKGKRTEWLLEFLAKHGPADYARLAPVQYPDLGDTRYARKLTSINVAKLAKDGRIERVPETWRPTLYRLPQ